MLFDGTGTKELVSDRWHVRQQDGGEAIVLMKNQFNPDTKKIARKLVKRHKIRGSLNKFPDFFHMGTFIVVHT